MRQLPSPQKSLAVSRISVASGGFPVAEANGKGVGMKEAGRFSSMDILTRPGLGCGGGGVCNSFVSFRFFCNTLNSNTLCCWATTICNRIRPPWPRGLLLAHLRSNTGYSLVRRIERCDEADRN
jgi:hypothetical protein